MLVWNSPTLGQLNHPVAPFLPLHKWMQLTTTVIGLMSNPIPLTSSELRILSSDNTTFPLSVYLLSHFLYHYFPCLLSPQTFNTASPIIPMLTVCFLCDWDNGAIGWKAFTTTSTHLPFFPCAHCLVLLPVIRHQHFVFLSTMPPSQLTLWHLQALRYKGRSPRWKWHIQSPFCYCDLKLGSQFVHL